MRLRITHRTWFDYTGDVVSSFNEARMSPLPHARQQVLDAQIDIRPAARVYRYEDYWGTVVTSFDLHDPHAVLNITATALVETQDAAMPETTPAWSELGDLDRWHELVLPTPRTALDEELTAVAASVKAAHGKPHDAALAVCELVRETVAYQPGSTGVQTNAVHAWRQRAGVCQDISHLVVGMLRTMGMPTRYVSGYMHPQREAQIGEEVAGQSHAWVEWWAGSWIGFDPTNGVPIQARHVTVGRGREYGDVPPLKGVYSGPQSSGQGVEVRIARLR